MKMYFDHQKLLLCMVSKICTREDRLEQLTVFKQYKLYVLGNYGKATVIFDRYSVAACTKYPAYVGRTGGKFNTAVHFIVIMTIRTKKEEILSNKDSKHMFTAMLFRSLERSGCEVHQAKADADLLIVQTTAASVANHEKLIFLWF